MTPEEESRIGANIVLFSAELGDLPRIEEMFDLLDLFARILQPEAARALVALIKIAAQDPEDDDADEDNEDDESDLDGGEVIP